MSKTTWADVKKGDVVKLDGRYWYVSKIKPKGKRARVTMDAAGVGECTGDVLLADRVKITPSVVEMFAKLGKKADAKSVEKRAKSSTVGQWSKPAPDDAGLSLPPGAAEANLTKILGARLLGEKPDGGPWYVPPVDVSTVAMHLHVFHGLGATLPTGDMAAMVAEHTAAHAAASAGESFLHVDHRHTNGKP